LARRTQLARNLDSRAPGDRLDIVVDERGQEKVVPPCLVHQRRARCAGLEHVMDRRQLREIDLDARRHVFGLGARRRDAHGDQFADMAYLSSRQHRLLGGLESRKPGHGPDRLYAHEVFGDEHAVADVGRDADRLDAAVGEGAPVERDVHHPWPPDVADELAAAAQETVVLLAQQTRADPLSGRAADLVVACHAPIPSVRREVRC